jgi:hypothetical protein
MGDSRSWPRPIFAFPPRLRIMVRGFKGGKKGLTVAWAVSPFFATRRTYFGKCYSL